jgi:hypothetical protein
MAEPDRGIHRMTWIAFILAAIAGLLSIIYARPVVAPVDQAAPESTRSK